MFKIGVKDFISCRRSILDSLLTSNIKKLDRLVLDIGGKKINKRGKFRLPVGDYKILYINIEESSEPDLVAAIPNIPLSDEIADVIICTEVLEYVDGMDGSLSCMYRLLRKGGTLYLSTPFMHRMHDDSENDSNRYTSTYLTRYLNKHFEDVRVIPMGGVWAVVFDLIYYGIKSRWIRVISRFVGSIISKANNQGSVYVTTGFFCIARK